MFIALSRRHVIQALVREVRIVIINPFAQSDFEFKRALPVIAPDDAFFDGAHDPFGIRIALRVRPGRKDLFDAENRAVHHKALTRWLAPVIRD